VTDQEIERHSLSLQAASGFALQRKFFGKWHHCVHLELDAMHHLFTFGGKRLHM
jgi:hypothetical protein